MKRTERLRTNVKAAKAMWGQLPKITLLGLKELTLKYAFSIVSGDLQLLDGRWYVTHSGLLALSARGRCHGIHVQQVRVFCDPVNCRWVFKATVYRTPRSKGFGGYGDADPSNVSTLMHGAEMRIAETRAVNRALRKAYGIGICSVEELGSITTSRSQGERDTSAKHYGNGSSNGQSRLRDQLCVLIRQHGLDPTLVKAYAADFCGIPSLKDASRELIESFVKHLALSAREDRAGLIAKLNSYVQPQETRA